LPSSLNSATTAPIRSQDRSASCSIFFCLSVSGPPCSLSTIRRYPHTTVTGVRSSCTAREIVRGKRSGSMLPPPVPHTTTCASADNLGRSVEAAYNYRMLIRHAPDLRFSDITPKTWYLRRREFLQTAAGAALGAAAAAMAPPFAARLNAAPQKEGTGHGAKLPNVVKSPLSTTGEKVTSWDDITSYNNFYEYGPYKEDPK